MNKILMSNRYFPIIVYSDNSTAYYNALTKGRTQRNKKAYFQFMMGQVKKTYNSFHKIIQEY
jgi:hypothetical protein